MIQRFGESFGPKVYYPAARTVLSVFLDDETSFTGQEPTIQATPVEVVVSRNSARKADTARVILQRRDFPIDPRLVRAIQVSVHIDDLHEVGDVLQPTRQNLRFIGQVDEPEAVLEEGGQTMAFDCRDYTAIWLDTRWPQGATLRTPDGYTLGQAIAKLRGVVEQSPSITERSTTPLVFSDPAAEHLVLKKRTGRRAFAPDKDEDNYWDVLCALCELYGLVPVYDLDRLVIRTPTEVGKHRVQLVYGHDVERLKYKRSFKQQKRRQVVIRAWNPEEGKVYEAIYPKDGGEAATTTRAPVQADGGDGEKPTKTIHRVQYSVEGLYDEAAVKKLAQIVYDEQAQLQMTGEVRTREMRDAEGASILELANGHRLVMAIDANPDRAAIVDGQTTGQDVIGQLTDPDRTDPMSEGAATMLVQAWTAAERVDEWYVLEAEHSWSAQDGYAARITFSEYVVER